MEICEHVLMNGGPVGDRKLQAMVVVVGTAFLIPAVVRLRVMVVMMVVIMIMIVGMGFRAMSAGQVEIFAQSGRCHACVDAEGEGQLLE